MRVIKGKTKTELANVEGAPGSPVPSKAVQISGVDTGGTLRVPGIIATDGDAAVNVYALVQYARQAAFNGTTWDRWRNNTVGTLLASAARTATTSSADQTLFNGRGVAVIIDVTAVTGAPSVTFAIEVKDSVSSKYVAVLTSAAITGTGTTRLRIYPGITATANVSASDIMDRTWRVTATHANADSITYSVSGTSLV